MKEIYTEIEINAPASAVGICWLILTSSPSWIPL